MVAETMNELYTLHNETTTTLTETYTTKTETATTGTTTYSSGDMIASNISLVGHQHRDNPGLLVQSPQYQLVLLVLSQMQMVIVSIQSVRLWLKLLWMH